MTRKQLFRELRAIAKCYGFKVIFKDLKEYGGFAYLDGSFIINPYNPMTFIINCFFHELAHELNAVEGKFPAYHRRWITAITRKQKLNLRRTALRAEIYTDNKGAELCKLWFPNIKYVKCYRNEEDRQFLRKSLEFFL